MKLAAWRALPALVLAACCGPASASDMPATPAPAELVEATAFTLQEALALPSGEAVTQGFVIVLHAEPGLTEPRQVAMPVLQCGARLAFPASRSGDGVLVALVLGDADLGGDLIFFSPPELASRVTAQDAARRLADAVAAGLRPAGAEAALLALSRGAAPLQLARFEDLSPLLMALRCRIEPDALAAAGAPCAEAP